MTTFNTVKSRNRDVQDGVEAHVWGSLTYIADAGAVVKVRGTGTTDEEAAVVNLGYSFNVSENFNTEVLLVSMGSDTNKKFALPTLPRDQQRPWPEGTGGVQHPTDKSRYLEFNGDETHLCDGKFVIGDQKQLTIVVEGNNVTIRSRGDISISTGGSISLESATLTHNGTNIGVDHVHSNVVAGGDLSGGPQ